MPDAAGGAAGRRGDLDGARPGPRVVGPAEEFLEYLRVQGTSPNTVKSYARALALWWTYLAVFGLAWDALTLAERGRVPGLAAQRGRPAGDLDRAAAREVRRVDDQHPAAGGDLLLPVPRAERRARSAGTWCGWCTAGGRSISRCWSTWPARGAASGAVIRVRASRRVPPPVLTPGQIEAICDACARFDAASGQWTGRVRDRLLWSLLAETGLRLGEALGLQHRDWHTGRGDTPFIEVVPREHPHGVRVKGGTLPAGVHLR